LSTQAFESALQAMTEISDVMDSGKYVPLRDRQFNHPRDSELIGISHFYLKVSDLFVILPCLTVRQPLASQISIDTAAAIIGPDGKQYGTLKVPPNLASFQSPDF
jgi:hypothetical protein